MARSAIHYWPTCYEVTTVRTKVYLWTFIYIKMIIIHEYHMMTDDDNINNNINNINNITIISSLIWLWEIACTWLVLSSFPFAALCVFVCGLRCSDSIRFCSDRGLSALLFDGLIKNLCCPP